MQIRELRLALEKMSSQLPDDAAIRSAHQALCEALQEIDETELEGRFVVSVKIKKGKTAARTAKTTAADGSVRAKDVALKILECEKRDLAINMIEAIKRDASFKLPELSQVARGVLRVEEKYKSRADVIKAITLWVGRKFDAEWRLNNVDGIF